MNRRMCLQSLFLAGLARATLATAASEEEEDFTRYVDVTIGTGGHGHTSPAATVPFGAVQLGPDTGNTGWDHCSGYHQPDRTLMGFSHTHLSGTGIGDMLDVLVIPAAGEEPAVQTRYTFLHSDERTEPGYYSLRLSDPQIGVELTATERVGLHRYTFPRREKALLAIDAEHGYASNADGRCRVGAAELEVRGDLLVGSRKVNEWAKGRELYFALECSRPWQEIRVDSDHRRATLSFGDLNGSPLAVKCAISGVSIAGAISNLRAEVPEWDFEGARRSARDRWQRELSKIRIRTKRADKRVVFYSALYHTMLAPTLFDDVDGHYRGMDGLVHQLRPGEHNYSTYSLWDTYRALHPLFTLIQPERVPDIVNCLIRMGKESPAGAPVWPLQGRETGCMSGYHSAVVIAEAATKGFEGLDLSTAWEWLSRRADKDAYRGLEWYRKDGYIPCDLEPEAASKTLEYAYDDWATAAVAEALEKRDEAARLRARSRNYRNLFDRKTTFMRPRLAGGNWAEPFDPRGLGHWPKWRDFTECNAWQATFLVQHDPRAYIDFFGGDEQFEAKLDQLFNQSPALPPDAPDDIAGMVGQYAHGNEPSHHIAYLYAYAGAPFKTQQRVRELLETMYSKQPDGLAGNEDCGQMSAWFVMSALGFYPVDPVSATYVLGTPLFDGAEVELSHHRRLMIETNRSDEAAFYVRGVRWNGADYGNSWMGHRALAAGGRLSFDVGHDPDKEFGKPMKSRPVAMATERRA